MEEIEFSRWLFEGRLRQGKNVLPDGPNWLWVFLQATQKAIVKIKFLSYFWNPLIKIMKNVVKSSKHFFGYFNTLEIHSVLFMDNLEWEIIG